MLRDPVCHMELSPGADLKSVTYEGKTYYFCSSHFKEAFLSDPETYVKAPQVARTDHRKIVIVGVGQVGSTFAFALLSSGLANSIVLIDRNRELADGHAMDLSHGLPFAHPTTVYAGTYQDCRRADVVVVTAGVAQKPGESRLELVERNIEIFKDIIPKIAADEPKIILIVSNPVDVLTYAAIKFSSFTMNRVFGSGTTLDTARFRYLIASHCNVDPRNVHAYIIGEHGDSEMAVWSQVNIAGVPLLAHCPGCQSPCTEDERRAIFDHVRKAAYEIIAKKGATNYAISLALLRIVGAILRDENSVLTVSTLVDNYHGVSDVCLNVPAIVNRNGISRVIKIRPMRPNLRDSVTAQGFSRKQLQQSAYRASRIWRD